MLTKLANDMMIFHDFDRIRECFLNKRVALFGSAPSCQNNEGSEIDKYDIIVRVNNYKIQGKTKDGGQYDYRRQVGRRTDVHYAFYGSSIGKTKEELIQDGVKLCMCKCPNSKPIDSPWHIRNGKPYGVDFRYIYKRRACFWFCPTFVPTDEHFLKLFDMLGRHIPTTGFSAIHDLKKTQFKELYITGYDFFRSKRHNITDPWRDKNPDDPIKHMPEKEARLLKAWVNKDRRIIVDRVLSEALACTR